MTDGRIENDSRIGTEGGGRETEGSIGTVDLIEIGGCIETDGRIKSTGWE